MKMNLSFAYLSCCCLTIKVFREKYTIFIVVSIELILFIGTCKYLSIETGTNNKKIKR